MKRSIVMALFAVSLVSLAVRAEEKPAAQPAAAPAAAPTAATTVGPAAPPAATPAVAPAGEDLRQEVMELVKQVNTLEREARKSDPTLNAKIADLDKQRRQLFIQVKPELEALYAQQDVLQEKAKAMWGKGAGQGGKRQGGGEAKAEKRAERATLKAEKAQQKAGTK